MNTFNPFLLLFILIFSCCLSSKAQSDSVILDSVAMDSTVMDSTQVAIQVTADTAEAIETDSSRLHKALDELYVSAQRSFGNIKGKQLSSEGGIRTYASNLEIPKAEAPSIRVDSERSHAFSAVYSGLTIKEAQEKEEEITAILFKRLQPEGYKRARGSDFKYYQYRLNKVEFDSDNIDDMGKHPSFTIGVKAGEDGSYMVVLTAIDPLWK